MRLPCDHCHDDYNEDNLNECARCKADTCWKCGIHAELPEFPSGTWWCDWCLEKVGRKDLLIGKRHSEKKRFRHQYNWVEKFQATEALKQLIPRSNPGTLPWPADEAEREALLRSLEAIGMSVDDDTGCFTTPPRRMPAGERELVFTEVAYWVFAGIMLAPPPWKNVR